MDPTGIGLCLSSERRSGKRLSQPQTADLGWYGCWLLPCREALPGEMALPWPVDGPLGDRLEYKCHDGVGASPPYPLLAHQGRSEDALVPLQTGPVFVGYFCGVSLRQLPGAPMSRCGALGQPTHASLGFRALLIRVSQAPAPPLQLSARKVEFRDPPTMCAPVPEVQ